MKKLIIAAAIVCVAAVSQAGYVKWSTMVFTTLNQPGTTTPLASGTAYLFDGKSYSQQALLDAFFSDGIDFTKAQDKATLTSGAIAATGHDTKTYTGGEYTEGSLHDMYFAIVNGDEVFVSQIQPYTAGAVDKSKALTFTVADASSKAATTWTTGGTPVTAGAWYTQAVPEPTSGLLLLLGVAGLALRRRRA